MDFNSVVDVLLDDTLVGGGDHTDIDAFVDEFCGPDDFDLCGGGSGLSSPKLPEDGSVEKILTDYISTLNTVSDEYNLDHDQLISGIKGGLQYMSKRIVMCDSQDPYIGNESIKFVETDGAFEIEVTEK